MMIRRMTRGFQPNEALAELLRADDEGAPFGGFVGELANPAATPPPSPAPRPVKFPPPDWAAEAAERKRVEREREAIERERKFLERADAPQPAFPARKQTRGERP